jgi:hypothetical protein
MLLNFTLVPIESIVPWGEPGNLSLSWFGLTDSEYWIEAGDASLFEYSAYARETGAHRYCDYQVVRLYEDILDMLPSILDQVPAHLVQYMTGDFAQSFREKYGTWCEEHFELLDEDQYWQIAESANTWIGARHLDSGYLRPSMNLFIWSDATHVHLEWDNSDVHIDGEMAWTAICGQFSLTREEFLAEIESFHHRLMDQMAARVEQVVKGALSPQVRIDMPGLIAEHEQRTGSLNRALAIQSPTNWSEVEDAVNTIWAHEV